MFKRVKRKCLQCDLEVHEETDGKTYRCRCGSFGFAEMMSRSVPVEKKMTRPKKPRTPGEMGEEKDPGFRPRG